MTKRSLITIIGKQKYGSDNDKIEMTTVGTLEEKDDRYIISYNEEQEPPRSPIKATLNVYKNEKKVEMIKAGPYSSCLIIERSERNLCNYGTEFGDTLMGIYGRSIEIDAGNTEGEFSFSYDIDINGALTSQNEVIVKYRITQ